MRDYKPRGCITRFRHEYTNFGNGYVTLTQHMRHLREHEKRRLRKSQKRRNQKAGIE